MGRPASFATRGMQFQHYIQLECPKGRDLDAKMIVLAPNTLFSPVFPKPDQPCFDLLRHDPDDTPESFKNLKPKFFTSAEFSTFVAERARSFCATTSYDPGLYTKNVDGCIAVINDLAGPNNDAKIFPGSSQLVVSEKYKQAFDSYGKATCFQSALKGQLDISFRKQTATDIVEKEDFPEFHAQMLAGAIAFFRCPVPGCMMEFSPILQLSRFYMHLEDAVYWEYFDAHGAMPCGFGCGRSFIIEMSYNRHIRNRQCAVAFADLPAVSDLDDTHTCTECDVSFDSFATLVGHSFPDDMPTGVKLSPHALCLLDKDLLWPCAREWISVNDFFPLNPSTGFLRAIRRLAPRNQKIHAVFVWRQSKYIGKSYLRGQRDARIATSRRLANMIQELKKADLQSIAVVVGQSIKSAMMPNFSASREL
jgi:hypothetical protein